MNQNFTIKQFLDLENYDDLISFYEKRLEQNSENYIDYIYLGLAYILNGNQIEGETTWFYVLTQENAEYTDLLISVLDEITAGFVENNQIDFAILIYQNLRSIEPNYYGLSPKTNNLIKQWIKEAINLTTKGLFNQAKYQFIIKFEDNQSYFSIEVGINNKLRQIISDKIKKNIHLLYDDLTAIKILENFYWTITH